ncbi:MAG: ATP-binding domain-containing protein [Lachnospiraceae bacterium]|nr:ATP-binding domain-containing protein [Lachnospiraceae bacterium]
MISFVNGGVQNLTATNSLKRNLLKMKDRYSGSAHFGFALSEIDNERIIVDAVIVTKEKGILAIKFASGDEESDLDQLDKIYILLKNILVKNQGLRFRRELAITIQSVIYSIDDTQQMDDIISERDFIEYYEKLESFDERYFAPLNEALDKIVSAKPRKLRSNVQKEDSYGAKIRNIERQIANMDWWQKTAAYEIPDRPQRIRGFIGSGKTVVLALKAAYLHFMDPNEEIAVTFYSRSLYEQYKKLINEFYMQYSGGIQADFEKIHLLHSWGTKYEPGLYSEVAARVNQPIYTYNEAAMKYGRDNSFAGVCRELLFIMDSKSIDNIKMYDYILIDEAQDLPPDFFRIAIRLFKDPGKRRLVYAYDELQTLNQSTMPSLRDMFGVDANGNDLVVIGNENEGEPKTDILLPICYRNTKWALGVALALGFGIYRDSTKQPLVQFFEDLKVWEQIGYKVAEGQLEYGSFVRLVRKNSPRYFEELLTPEEAVQVHEPFENKDEEYTWIAKQIKKNIEEDELEPDDILVIFPNAYEAKKHYKQFSCILDMIGINSIMPGVNIDRDTFSKTGSITCTHIYRAKGNEKPMVYLADAEYGCLQSEIVQARNILFTAITRSRAWIRISGVGSGMAAIMREIQVCRDKNYALEINIPPEEEIKELNLLNRGNQKNSENLKSVERAAEDLIKLLKNSGLETTDIPQLNDLMNLIGKKE